MRILSYDPICQLSVATADTSVLLRVARLAAQLARERAGTSRSLEELAADACQVIASADEMRQALARQLKPPAGTTRALSRIAHIYGAEYIGRHDLAGMSCGYRFRSGSYTAGFHNVYFLS